MHFKALCRSQLLRPGELTKTVRVMKLTAILLFACCLQALAKTYGQSITLSEKNVSLKKIFKEIKIQSDYTFVYRDELLKQAIKVDIDLHSASIEQALEACFKNQPLTYTLVKTTVVVRLKPTPAFQPDTSSSLTSPPSIEIHGRVVDENGKPLSGVNIKVKNGITNVVTNDQGEYSIIVSENAVLLISYIGYEKQEVAVNNQTTINVKLKIETIVLNQVIVTALGIRREARSLTYSAQSVNTKQLSETREPNIMTSLEGKIAGLAINESGTGIGAPARVVLRGDRSFAGDSQPLYILDGVPILGYPEQLNADNIASLDVLKGPNAAALYGSAAQNGAIIITTRVGSNTGKVKVSLNNTYMIEDPIMAYQFQNVYGQGNGGVYSKNSESSWGPKMEGQSVDNWSPDPALAGTKYAFTPQPNNIRDYFQKGYNMATHLLASVGGEKTQALFAYTFTNAQGTISSNGLKRHNVSVRINSQLSNRIQLDTKIEYIHQNYTGGFTGNSYGSVGQIYSVPRNIQSEQMEKFEYESPEGLMLQNYWRPGSIVSKNPYWTLHRDVSENAQDRVIGMTSLSYQFSNALKLMVRASLDGRSENGSHKLYNDNYNVGQFGYYSVTRSNEMEWNGDALLSYSKDLTKNWHINANFGGNLKQQRNGSLSSNTGDFCCLIVPNFFALSNTLQVISRNDVGKPLDIQSIYAFGHVAWKNSLFLDITGRNDWSSTLPPASRSYFYPSVGLSAVLSDLIPSFPKLFSFAKLRASWAQVGNSTSPYQLDRTATFAGGGRNGFLTINGTLPNANLHPENTQSLEAGFNAGFFESRLGFDATFYKTNTRDQLFSIELPIGSGAARYFTNGGDVENKGIELQLFTTPVKTVNVRWDVNLNFSANRSKVLEISDLRSQIDMGYILEAGKPWGNIFTQGFMRDSLGRVIVDNTGMPRITTGKTVLAANFNPDWLGSISSTLTYKNISLYFLIDHRQGGTITSGTISLLYYSGTAIQTLEGREGGLVFGENLFPNETAVTDNGSPNKTPISAETFWVGMGSTANPIGEAFVESATNTRLRELSIGYSIPKSMLGRLPFSNVKFSLVGRNLFFIYRASKTLDADLMNGTGPGTLGRESSIRPTSRTFGIAF